MSIQTDQPKQDRVSTDPWPVAVRLVDVDCGNPSDHILAEGHWYHSLLAIGRYDLRPFSAVLIPIVEGVPQTRSDVQTAFAELSEPAPPSQAILRPPVIPAVDAAVKSASPDVSIIVPTIGGDVDELIVCIRRLLDQLLPPLEVIVVDNRPTNQPVQEAIAANFSDEPRVRLIEEPVKGLSAARNAGLHAARGVFVAFTDDDVQADPRWLQIARERFEEAADIACVTGLIIPIELENEAQLLFDRFAGFGKGFVARTYRLDEPPENEPLFPYTPGRFGSGANAVFRRADLEALGGYDNLLGAGTPANGGEDLDMYFRIVASGRALSYEPAAIVWHRHPRSLHEVREHVFTYGVGLGASLTKQAMSLRTNLDLLKRLPAAVVYLLHPQSNRNARKGGDFPRLLSALEIMGLVYGPVAFARSYLAAASARRRRG
jgi:glycosyltransferase involved in cell wall biosynthesis